VISGTNPHAGDSDADWVTVALLGKPRGNRGEVTAVSFSSKPERYSSLSEVWLFGLGSGEPPARFGVEFTWFHQGTLIFKFQGIDSISDAATLAGAEVRIPIGDRAPLDPGEYFQSDLVGCEVVEATTGKRLGRVTEWDDSGGTGLLVLEGDLLIPFARSICISIDPTARRIEVELPEGLKELNRR
jgi:16S rRNA processing protein RimM